MPGVMDGADLARWVVTNRPSLAVILASGGLREEQVVVPVGAEVPFLTKPFQYERVRNLLDRAFGAPQAVVQCAK